MRWRMAGAVDLHWHCWALVETMRSMYDDRWDNRLEASALADAALPGAVDDRRGTGIASPPLGLVFLKYDYLDTSKYAELLAGE